VEPDEYARIAAAEDEHWWYQGTRALAAQLLGPWLGRPGRFLDAGCGPGGNGAWLADRGTVVGVDLAAEALKLVRTRHPQVLATRGSLDHLPFPDACFDVVLCLTVLYTVLDDGAALGELARVVAPGGAVLLIEPAFAALRRAHDATVHGRRRYRRAELAQRVRATGLDVQRSTYAFSFLAPPAAALALADRVLPPRKVSPSDVERRGLDRLFAPLARAERRVLAHRNLPVGTSAVVLATRER
jgi:SAM-dependent methyltransferase